MTGEKPGPVSIPAISSRLSLEARHLWTTVRVHLEIENGLHGVPDAAFREDADRVRKGHDPRNLCLPRRTALNLFPKETTVQTGMAIRHRKAGHNLAYMEKVPGLA